MSYVKGNAIHIARMKFNQHHFADKAWGMLQFLDRQNYRVLARFEDHLSHEPRHFPPSSINDFFERTIALHESEPDYNDEATRWIASFFLLPVNQKLARQLADFM